MRELVLMCAMAVLGAGCVEVIPHIDEYDAGPPDVKSSDATGEPDVMMGPCQSGQRWMGTDTTSSPLMAPGRACMGGGCHTSSSKTPITLGGTVYPLKGEHDEDNCNGLDFSMVGGALQVTDESGADLFPRLQINNVGNFYTTRQLPASFKVKLISQGREIEMKAPVTNGDCNYCHRKEDYMGAKGRIVPAAP